jgi:hypothetical protein
MDKVGEKGRHSGRERRGAFVVNNSEILGTLPTSWLWSSTYYDRYACTPDSPRGLRRNSAGKCGNVGRGISGAVRNADIGNVLVAKALDFHLIIAACESSTCAVL